ncbi:aldo/keto reductase [Sinomonas gamaensis]|jgi:diketogulonate reductase-like aldo/keto reductase|uniref:aldo/keto reductase n=1 Tax=Sinomonas gamaensis TaxID=2565624 RepID=UPI001109731E|nr:aldo/keto reductase [Sinomonas gamaensis]
MIPTVTLNNGVQMPQLGFGVFKVAPDECAAAVSEALKVGYRSIDTAAIYKNEEGVGKAIAESGIARDELFVTSKLWNGEQGYDSTLRAFEVSLQKLGLDYLDLYLIHWPTPDRGLYPDTWRAFETLYKDGRIRAIGLSNFQPNHISRILEVGSVVPAVNQIELHPYLTQTQLRKLHHELGIHTEAWSPLGQGLILEDPLILSLADKYERTPAQVVLRWHLQAGTVTIPKSVTPARIRENFEVFDFELDSADAIAIDGLDRAHRTGLDPDTFHGV